MTSEERGDEKPTESEAARQGGVFARIDSLAPRMRESIPMLMTLTATIFYCINMFAIMVLAMILTE